MKRFMEFLIWNSRYVIYLAVIISIISAICLVLISTIKFIHVISEIKAVFTGSYDNFFYVYQNVLSGIITIVDFFLIASFLLIFGFGLYELFISKIEAFEKDSGSAQVLVIHSIDELKNKLANLIILVLIVTFFNYAFKFEYKDITSLLYLAFGILLISLSSLAMKFTKSKSKE